MSLKEQPNDFTYVFTRKSQSKELIFAPEGWDKNSKISYKRDMNYFGVMRQWALPMDFVLDAANFLRRAYFEDGVEAVVKIDVYELNRSTWEKELAYSGDIDFSEFDGSSNVVSVTLMESGATQDIKAFENVKYEYPLIGNDVVNMSLPGVVFTEGSQSFLPQSPSGTNARFMPAIDLVVNDMLSGYAVAQNTEFQPANDSSFIGSSNWFVKADRALNLSMSGSMQGNAGTLISGQGFDIYIVRSDNTFISTLYSSPTLSSISTPFAFNFNVNISANAGDRFFIYCRFRSTVGSKNLQITEGTLDVNYSTTSDASNCKGIKAFDLYKRIINRVSPGYPIESFLLKNRWENLIFTSGEGIREIIDSSIKISLKDFYLTMDAIDDTGMGIENGILRMEESAYFARNIEAINVGEADCKLSVAKDFMFNSVKIGYNDGNTDEKNGREEYNSGQQWALPITRIQKEKNWVSPTRADQFGIENLRINFVKKSTTDTDGDNDNFMIDCEPISDFYRPVLGSSYQLVEGLSSPATAYNLRLTPKKNLLRHSGLLRSILDRLDTRFINFGSGEKNTSLVTTKDSVTVKENENISVGSLPGKYFIPVIADINCKLPISARKLFDSNPFGYVSFVWHNVTLQGYILECNVDVARNTEQEFKLLLTPNNNLLNLIQWL